mmetsp:Transcript_8999/g.11488  ORF Transcript_8999/g.11488 Transcript_8999/m.11488 type:complete len:95 (-) Transcript_8999:678-962(-)
MKQAKTPQSTAANQSSFFIRTTDLSDSDSRISSMKTSQLSTSQFLSWLRARERWEIKFFSSFGISAKVNPLDSSGSKTGSHPKSSGPLAGTIFP